MRWLLTLVLLALVVAGAAFALFGRSLLVRSGLERPAALPADSRAAVAGIDVEKIDRVSLAVPGQPELVLERTGKVWTQPGNWPVREREVRELVDALAGVHSRFAAASLGGAALADFGLAPDQKPVSATLRTEGRTIKMLFGQPPAAKGSDATARPAYVRIDEANEVLQIAPDTLRIVARNPEEYRRRQLFAEAARTRFGGDESGPPLPVPTNDVAEITVNGPGGSFSIVRTRDNPATRREADRPTASQALFAGDLAESWKLGKPVSDRVDPSKLRAILTALPDLWVDGFVAADPNASEPASEKYAKSSGFTRDYLAPRFEPGAALAGVAVRSPLVAEYPIERQIRVELKSGPTRTLRIGKVSRSTTRVEPGPNLGPMAPPPMPRIVEEKYYLAKFEENPLVFEVRGDKLEPIFVAPDDLRDAALARFAAAEVNELRIAPKGGAPFTLTRKLGKKDAEKDEDKSDRWYLGDRLADAGKIGEFLDQLGKLETKSPADWSGEPIPAGSTLVRVSAQARVPEGDPAPPLRTYTLQFGAADAIKKRVPVQVAGWDRVNSIEDSISKLVERPAVAYRSRKQYDTAEMKLAQLSVTETKRVMDKDADAVLLELKSKPKTVGTGLAWDLLKPVATPADEAKTAKLIDDVTRLEAVDYLDENPSAADLADKYGFTPSAKPELVGAKRLTLQLGFAGTGGKPETLVIAQPKTGEIYARRNGTGPVFTVAKPLVETLERGSLDLLPLQLWSATPDKIAKLEFARAGEKYQLAPDGAKWKLTGPFEASAAADDLLPLTGTLSQLRAVRYDSLTSEMKHGFDKPTLTLSVTIREPKADSKTTPPEETPVLHTLVVGNPVAEEPANRFAKLTGGPNTAVFVIPGAIIQLANKPALAWLDRNLLALDPSKITKVEIKGPNPESNLVLVNPDKTDWKPEGANFPLDKLLVGNLLMNATNPPVLRLAAYGPNIKWADFGLEKPEYTFAITTSEKPAPVVVKLGKEEPTGERFVRINDDPAVGVISGATTAALARGKLELADRGLFAFDPAKLVGISRKKGTAALELAKTGDKWEGVQPKKFAADTAGMDELVDGLSRLRASKVAAIEPKDFKPFGIDVPTAELTLNLGDNKPLKLQIGKPVDDAKPTGDRFARFVDTGAAMVKVLPGPVANRLLGEPIAFQDRLLFAGRFVDADKIVIERGDRTATFAKVDGTWKMLAPIPAEAEQADLDELVNAVAKFRADELVAEKPGDLKPFGLDAPRTKVKFQLDGKDVLSIFLGEKEKDGPRVHAMVEKGELVGLLETTLGNRLLGEYRKRAVWSGVDASQIGAIAFSDGKANFALQKAGPLWSDAAKPADQFDAAKITEMLAALAQLKAERYIADKDAKLELYGLKEPKRVIVLSSQDGRTTKVLQIGTEVGGTGGKQVYARVDEPGRTEVFILSEADTAKFTRDRAALLKK